MKPPAGERFPVLYSKAAALLNQGNLQEIQQHTHTGKRLDTRMDFELSFIYCIFLSFWVEVVLLTKLLHNLG